MIILYLLIFFVSALALFWSGSWLVQALMKVAKYLKWREFVIAFFIMSFATSLPNLFVGINAALHKIPQLSLGDIWGGNLVDLTLAIALAVLILKTEIPAESRMVQISAIFTVVIALLPLLLMLDGTLGRVDGILLLLCFAFYSFWLFSKQERFKKIYDGETLEIEIIKNFKELLKNIGKIILSIFLLLLASEGMVLSVKYFVYKINIPLEFIAILFVGLGNCLPEIYFSIASAKRRQTWMILGNLMGSVIVCTTLILGIVCLIAPIKISDFSPFAAARIFLIIAAAIFLIVVKTGRKITKKEAIFLLMVYLAFVIVEILLK